MKLTLIYSETFAVIKLSYTTSIWFKDFKLENISNLDLNNIFSLTVNSKSVTDSAPTSVLVFSILSGVLGSSANGYLSATVSFNAAPNLVFIVSFGL